MVFGSGDWDWSRISPFLPSEIRDRIAAVQPPRVGLGADAPEWRWIDTRQFTSSSAYSFLSDMASDSSDNFWQKVCALPIPQRVRTFLWITLHNCNLTNAERYRRHLTPSAKCDICGYHTEDMDHILWHCVAARGIWSRDRCNAVLDSENILREDILARGDRLVHECVNVFTNSMSSSPSVHTKSLQWSRSAPGWIKDQKWDLVVCHSPRTCNLLANMLATWGRLNSQGVLTLSSPPSSLLAVVEAEKNGSRINPLELQGWYGNVAAVCFALREDRVAVELLEMVSDATEPVGIG
ncbi:hypothetical protein V6N13_045745 [Hibiscus sabdariffa]